MDKTALLLMACILFLGCTQPGPSPAEQGEAEARVVEAEEVPEPAECAEEGEQVSKVYREYPRECCEGLTEWQSGMDTRMAIGDGCYMTGLIAGAPIGTCIDCGNGMCGESETPCNCPEDCAGGQNADYADVEAYCSDGGDSFSDECRARSLDFPLCGLC